MTFTDDQQKLIDIIEKDTQDRRAEMQTVLRNHLEAEQETYRNATDDDLVAGALTYLYNCYSTHPEDVTQVFLMEFPELQFIHFTQESVEIPAEEAVRAAVEGLITYEDVCQELREKFLDEAHAELDDVLAKVWSWPKHNDEIQKRVEEKLQAETRLRMDIVWARKLAAYKKED